MPTMQAIRLHSYGPPEVLVMDEVPRPDPAPGEVLIRGSRRRRQSSRLESTGRPCQRVAATSAPFDPGLGCLRRRRGGWP